MDKRQMEQGTSKRILAYVGDACPANVFTSFVLFTINRVCGTDFD